MMKLEDDWAIEGNLPVNAFLISLQGLANAVAPRLYFVYPEKWDFLYTPTVLDYYREKRNYTFTELKTPEAALKTFRGAVKGYVVWDKASAHRSSSRSRPQAWRRLSSSLPNRSPWRNGKD
jgi:hypothetical protein